MILRDNNSLAETLVSFAEEAIRNRGFVGPIMRRRGKYPRNLDPLNLLAEDD